MKVTLLAYTQLNPEIDFDQEFAPRNDQLKGTDLEKLTEIAGRTCYDSFGKGRATEDYHLHIFDVGHGSVLEHATATVLISGVSRGLTHELIRHRVGTAVSQRSTRYVDESESVVIEHPKLLNLSETSKFQIQECHKNNRQLYKSIVEDVEWALLADGVDKLTARKQARGAARGFLENGMETELVWTMNMRAMLNIVAQRGVIHADAEIQQLAMEFLKIGMKVCPAYFSQVKLEDGFVVNPKELRI